MQKTKTIWKEIALGVLALGLVCSLLLQWSESGKRKAIEEQLGLTQQGLILIAKYLEQATNGQFIEAIKEIK